MPGSKAAAAKPARRAPQAAAASRVLTGRATKPAAREPTRRSRAPKIRAEAPCYKVKTHPRVGSNKIQIVGTRRGLPAWEKLPRLDECNTPAGRVRVKEQVTMYYWEEHQAKVAKALVLGIRFLNPERIQSVSGTSNRTFLLVAWFFDSLPTRPIKPSTIDNLMVSTFLDVVSAECVKSVVRNRAWRIPIDEVHVVHSGETMLATEATWLSAENRIAPRALQPSGPAPLPPPGPASAANPQPSAAPGTAPLSTVLGTTFSSSAGPASSANPLPSTTPRSTPSPPVPETASSSSAGPASHANTLSSAALGTISLPSHVPAAEGSVRSISPVPVSEGSFSSLSTAPPTEESGRSPSAGPATEERGRSPSAGPAAEEIVHPPLAASHPQPLARSKSPESNFTLVDVDDDEEILWSHFIDVAT